MRARPEKLLFEHLRFREQQEIRAERAAESRREARAVFVPHIKHDRPVLERRRPHQHLPDLRIVLEAVIRCVPVAVIRRHDQQSILERFSQRRNSRLQPAQLCRRLRGAASRQVHDAVRLLPVRVDELPALSRTDRPDAVQPRVKRIGPRPAERRNVVRAPDAGAVDRVENGVPRDIRRRRMARGDRLFRVVVRIRKRDDDPVERGEVLLPPEPARLARHPARHQRDGGRRCRRREHGGKHALHVRVEEAVRL